MVKNMLGSRNSLPMGRLLGGGFADLFASPFLRTLDNDLDEMYSNLMPTVEKTEEGYVYHYNLAGFEQQEISLKLEPKANTLLIVAEHTTEGKAARRLQYSTSLGEGKISPAQISTAYRNGMLAVTVRRGEEEEDVDAYEIPLNADGDSKPTALEVESSQETG